VGIDNDEAFARVIAALNSYGFLLESDPHLPSVCGIVTGEPLRGSWWSHPLAHTIFSINEQLSHLAEIVTTKLVSSKVTFVEKKLWPDILAIGSARATWQMKKLSPGARALLKKVDAAGYLRTDQIQWNPARYQASVGDATRELEKKLLVLTAQIHTETGSHAKAVESWQSWRQKHQLASSRSIEHAMSKLTQLMAQLNAQFNARGTLPWTTR